MVDRSAVAIWARLLFIRPSELYHALAGGHRRPADPATSSVTHTLWPFPRSNGNGKGYREAVACPLGRAAKLYSDC